MNMDIVAVDISTYRTYDFLEDGETTEELLARANASKENEIEAWKRNCAEYPDIEQFQIYLKQAMAKQYEIMTFDEFKAGERNYLLGDELKEITEEKWEEMLCVLPPIYHCTIDGVEMFCMSEMWTGTYTTQCARCSDGKCYCKMVDVLDQTTWIHNILRERKTA